MTLIWLDLETTGLVPTEDKILEIAMRASSEDRFYMGGFERVLDHDGQGLSPFIVKMHTESGLLDACRKSSTRMFCADAERAAIDWLDKLGRDVSASVPFTLAGSSVHFDVGFLRLHMPRLAAQFSHRLFDVSAIKMFCESLGMSPIPKAQAHRALPDVEESFAHYRACADWLFPPDRRLFDDDGQPRF